MNKPENEMLYMVLEKKVSAQTGKEYYTGFLGINSIYANEHNGKLYIKIQKWPKKENANSAFKSTEEDVPF
jgi:hypothetical protein